MIKKIVGVASLFICMTSSGLALAETASPNAAGSLPSVYSARDYPFSSGVTGDFSGNGTYAANGARTFVSTGPDGATRTGGNAPSGGPYGLTGYSGSGFTGYGYSGTGGTIRPAGTADGYTGTDWGWIGLLGLIGLAGIFGRNRANQR
jgi:hypothetical protein